MKRISLCPTWYVKICDRYGMPAKFTAFARLYLPYFKRAHAEVIQAAYQVARVLPVVVAAVLGVVGLLALACSAGITQAQALASVVALLSR
jgi:hypothetical protein